MLRQLAHELRTKCRRQHLATAQAGRTPLAHAPRSASSATRSDRRDEAETERFSKLNRRQKRNRKFHRLPNEAPNGRGTQANRKAARTANMHCTLPSTALFTSFSCLTLEDVEPGSSLNGRAAPFHVQELLRTEAVPASPRARLAGHAGEGRCWGAAVNKDHAGPRCPAGCTRPFKQNVTFAGVVQMILIIGTHVFF